MAKKQNKNQLDKMSFEDTIAKLENIVDQIESGQTPLEESLEQYEQGMTLISHCRDILKKCEDKIEKISNEAKRGEEKDFAQNQQESLDEDAISEDNDEELF